MEIQLRDEKTISSLDLVKEIKKDLNKNVSLMSFICQSFVWFYESQQQS